jgi:hypothetical protein
MPDRPEGQVWRPGADAPGLDPLVGQALRDHNDELLVGRLVHDSNGIVLGQITAIQTDDAPTTVSLQGTEAPGVQDARRITIATTYQDEVLRHNLRNMVLGNFVSRSTSSTERRDVVPFPPRPRQHPSTYPRWWTQALARMEHLRLVDGEPPIFPPHTARTLRQQDDRVLQSVLADVEIRDVELRASATVGAELMLEATAVGVYRDAVVRIEFTGHLEGNGYLGGTFLRQIRIERPAVPEGWLSTYGPPILEPFTDMLQIPPSNVQEVHQHIDLLMRRAEETQNHAFADALMGVDLSSGHDISLSQQYMTALGRAPSISEAVALAATAWREQEPGRSESTSNRRERRARQYGHRPEGRYLRTMRERLAVLRAEHHYDEPGPVLGLTAQGWNFTANDFVCAMQAFSRVGEELAAGFQAGIAALPGLIEQITQRYRTLVEVAPIAVNDVLASESFGLVIGQFQAHLAEAREIQEQDRRERTQAQAQRTLTAEETARALLISRLDEAQQRTYLSSGWFEILVPSERLGGRTPRRYRIHNHSYSHNIKLMSLDGSDAVLASLCVHPSNYDLPQPDVMLAQKLMLEWDHGETWGTANVSYYDPYYGSEYERETQAVTETRFDNNERIEAVVGADGRITRRRAPARGTTPRQTLRDAARAAIAELHVP